MNPHSELFQLDSEIRYLNCAYMSPLLKSVEEAGMRGMRQKRSPSLLVADDFFSTLDVAKERFKTLVNAPTSESIALLPSASYGLASAISNVSPSHGKHVLILKGEFPSGRLAVERWAEDHLQEIKELGPEDDDFLDGNQWNERVLNAITPMSTMLVMSSVHWMNGITFDLKAIGDKCEETNTVFIVDGTQGVGAAPMDVQECKIDALVCAGYKWLMGPYATGIAYYGNRFHHGRPIEESWMNRTNARAFSELTNYGKIYTPEAGRYNVGQTSNFILAPMLSEALRQVNEWGTETISTHSRLLCAPLVDYIKAETAVDEMSFQSHHIMGLPLPVGMTVAEMDERLKAKKVVVSKRGRFLRISPHLYNTAEDISSLMSCFQ